MPDLEWSVGKCYYTEINFVKIFIFERFLSRLGGRSGSITWVGASLGIFPSGEKYGYLAITRVLKPEKQIPDIGLLSTDSLRWA
jgi:hypothetical protein